MDQESEITVSDRSQSRNYGAIPKTRGARRTVAFHLSKELADLSVTLIVAGLSLLFIYASSVISLPDSVVVFTLIIFFTSIALSVSKILDGVIFATRFLIREFKPPYEENRIKFEIPNSGGETGHVEWDSIYWRGWGGFLLHLSIAVGCLCLLWIWLTWVEEPMQSIRTTINLVPNWLVDTAINMVKNYTSVSIRKPIGQIQDPAAFIFLSLLYLPLLAFGGMATWNFIYSLQVWVRNFTLGSS